MGAALAGILSAAIDGRTRDDLDRDGVLMEAAATATVERDAFDGLLDESARDLPDEPTVRRLLEAAGVDDVGEALNTARRDGDRFEGDEVPWTDVQEHRGLRILEAIGTDSATGNAKYRVVIARPCEGKGPGSRIYEASMLQRDASNFAPQPVFFNHEDLGTMLKRGHGSRDPRDLAGRITESAWDPKYTEPDDKKNGFGKGAVVGTMEVLQEAATIIDALPGTISVSMNMDPTKLRLRKRSDGKLGTLVEGIRAQSGSVDLITGEPGAGGRVLERLREAAEARYASEHADLAALDADRLVEAVRARPDVLAKLQPDPEAPVKIETDQLIEAMADEGTQAKLVEALAKTPAFESLVEAQVAEREDRIRDEATAESQRVLDLRDMRDEAHRLVEAHELLGAFPSFVDDVKSRYSLTDGRYPSPALDLYDQLDDSGAVVKSKMDRLRESVEADIEREVRKLREAAPTRIQGLGPIVEAAEVEGNPAGGGDGGEGGGNGNGGGPAQRQDPLANRLGLDPSKVHAYRGNR